MYTEVEMEVVNAGLTRGWPSAFIATTRHGRFMDEAGNFVAFDKNTSFNFVELGHDDFVVELDGDGHHRFRLSKRALGLSFGGAGLVAIETTIGHALAQGIKTPQKEKATREDQTSLEELVNGARDFSEDYENAGGWS